GRGGENRLETRHRYIRYSRDAIHDFVVERCCGGVGRRHRAAGETVVILEHSAEQPHASAGAARVLVRAPDRCADMPVMVSFETARARALALRIVLASGRLRA